jgi:squalene-hopene/tetraprenyl-beta-curcumene cyclase
MNQSLDTSNATAARAISPHDEFVARVDYTIDRAQQSLIAVQHPEGYWHAALDANAEMNAEYIIFSHFMEHVDLELEAKLKKHLLDTQNPDGSWSLYAGGEGYLSSSIEAYFALKLAGLRPSDEPLVTARRWILSRGGIVNCGTLARFYLAALGQVPWEATASLPVEIVLLPNWFPFNVYELASWARGTVFGLAVMQATRKVKQVSYQEGVLELYIQPPHFTRFKQPPGKRLFSLRSLLNLADRALRVYDRHHLASLRGSALRAAESWLLEHQEANGSWGGIQPCYLLSAMALKALGYRNDHPVMKLALSAARELLWDFGDRTLCMPCVSPNWDSALAAKALLDSGLAPDHPSLQKCTRWFIDHQVFEKGDWSIKRPRLEPGGWPFEFYNDCYPDVDDSAVILNVLSRVKHGDTEALQRAIRRGANWTMGMQSRDGGFAAFDVDNDSTWLNHLPLADVEAVTDPSCADLTGRMLEMMGAVGYKADHPVANRAIGWLKRNQNADGAWWGRWGVAYVYGTSSALAGLRAVGADLDEPWIKRAVQWLKDRQNPDGGWGESPRADIDSALAGRGAGSCASQTAWALIGLICGENGISEQVMRGVQWLAERQNDAGSWDETESTGNGFPNHFYLRYYMYPHYFPLMALGQFRRRLEETASR